MKRISIFGLGYVGCVSVGCLAKMGHTVIGVDISPHKVELMNTGKPTIIEKQIDDLIAESHAAGRISATADSEQAILDSDMSFVCVGTPSRPEGHLNIDYIFKVADEIGHALQHKSDFHIIVIRSTVFPGTNEKFGEIIEKVSHKKRNQDFALVSNPEFLREGTAVEDYFNPALTVLGSDNKTALQTVAQVYESLSGPIVQTEIKVAEMIKYVNNSFHALKIAFANEVGNICKAMHIDSHELMNIFKMDHRLNISPAYLTPGFAYGGSCLPKDLKGLSTMAHDLYLKAPLLNAVHDANEYQKQRLFDMIAAHNTRHVGIIGISFKEGTDDLRFSPAVDVVEKLIGKGYTVRIYDDYVSLSKLTGTNKEFIESQVPHISKLLYVAIEDVIAQSDIIIVNHRDEALPALIRANPDKIFIDLVRAVEPGPQNVQGICW